MVSGKESSIGLSGYELPASCLRVSSGRRLARRAHEPTRRNAAQRGSQPSSNDIPLLHLPSLSSAPSNVYRPRTSLSLLIKCSTFDRSSHRTRSNTWRASNRVFQWTLTAASPSPLTRPLPSSVTATWATPSPSTASASLSPNLTATVSRSASHPKLSNGPTSVSQHARLDLSFDLSRPPLTEG